MEKNLQTIELMDLYSCLLTDKQREALSLHYEYDLTHSEIAQNLDISRQAVRDTLIKAENLLNLYEQKLKLNSIKKQLQKAKECQNQQQSAEIINQILQNF